MTAIPDPIAVALLVADALEALGLRYTVGGSLASSMSGEPRSTLDVDMVVAIEEADVAPTDRGGALDVGTPQTLFPLHTQGLVGNQPHNVVTANGQKFLVNAIVGESDNVPLEVTLNWAEGLRK